MKSHKFIAKFMIAAFVACIVGACTDLAKIEDRLDDLDSKVTANESQISALNKNLEALKHLKDGAVISKFEETADGYKITLSNGRELTIVMSSASASDTVFSDVEVDGDVLELTLAEDGSVLQVPIVNGFKFEIRNGESLVDGLQKIMVGNTATYDVVQEGVASAAIVACPAGFDVELTETTLSVTALAQTKASASLSKDLAILVVSNKGLSILSKMQVEFDTPPYATVTASEVADRTSLTFSVALLNTETYKYMILPAATEAPTAETILAEGTNSTSANLTVNELQPMTEYVLYVLPVNGELTGEIASATSSTTGNDYEKYMAGLDLTVGTLTINKETYGDATLITDESANKEIGIKGVFFIDSAAQGVTINNAEALVVIGLGDTKPVITKTNTIYINKGEKNYIAFRNVTLSTTPSVNNLIAPGGTEEFTVTDIIFDNCKVNVPADKNIFYSKWPVNSISMTDTDVAMAKNTTNDKSMFNLSATTTVPSVKVSNNIFYCNDGDVTSIKVLGGNNVTISSLEFKNNTFARLYPVASNGFISCKAITAANIVSNLFYLPEYTSKVSGYSGIIRMPNDAEETGISIKSNLAFYDYDTVPSTRMKASFYSDDASGKLYNKAKADNPIPSPDYVNGVFIPGETYKSYGAKR